VKFFRSYVYEPLGADQWGKARQAINMLVCCILVGLWHSTGLNYLVWAVYLWTVLTVELYIRDNMQFWPDWVCRGWTIWMLVFGCILFSHENLGELKSAVMATLGYGGFSMNGLGRCIFRSIPLILTCAVGCTNLPLFAKRIFAGVCGMDPRSARTDGISVLRIAYALVCLMAVLMLLWVCTVALASRSALPFIYSQF
jgi:hypothetical protein